jgi:hypothetical protein
VSACDCLCVLTLTTQTHNDALVHAAREAATLLQAQRDEAMAQHALAVDEALAQVCACGCLSVYMCVCGCVYVIMSVCVLVFVCVCVYACLFFCLSLSYIRRYGF